MKTEHIVNIINGMVSNLLKVAIICVLLVGVSGCSADTSTKDTIILCYI